MELWYTDKHTEDVNFSIKVKRQLASHRSEIQQIDILDTYGFGRVLVLDGDLMITEKDEYIYHEMMTHVPMAVHPHVESVLVVGGGDGGTVRELVKYPGIKEIDLVESDKEVVTLSSIHLPFTACKLRDPRVRMHFEDGLRFVRGKNDAYDLIVVDCPDPYGPAEGLFTREFYGNCCNALKDDGILINQHESPFYAAHQTSVKNAHAHISYEFSVSTVYQCHIPSYPSGHWLFGFASLKYDPVRDLDAARWESLGISTRYYNTELHRGAFALPNYVRELLNQK